ncbi:hypothetical protein MNBD_PLANCTO02-1461 [hydrothermal vent metagenome]|uniref:Anti-sigma-28 factor FlgM C-terminal domain-containing protein n=1 Tax=hydrothermal vent metagenome TaxID=652676 RepID=A0A3B1D696_9ZZZZ
MEVNGLGSIPNLQPVQQTKSATTPTSSPASGTQKINTTDELQISSAAEMIQQLGETSSLHNERLAQIKAAIKEGTYETPEKMEAALSKILNEIQP